MKFLRVFAVSLVFMVRTSAQELAPTLTLKPTKMQVFGGVGKTIVKGDEVSESQFVGVASLHFFGNGNLLRPYTTIGQINPEKAGVDTFETGQIGVMLGKKVTPSLLVLAGGSVVGLFPENGDDEFRPTINLAANLTVYKSDAGLLQVLTPISHNWSKSGQGSTTFAAGLAWVF